MFCNNLLFMNIGGPEMMLIMFIALLMFGGKKLPELARGLGKGIREFKDASEDVKREINNQINSVEQAVSIEHSNYSETADAAEVKHSDTGKPHEETLKPISHE